VLKDEDMNDFSILRGRREGYIGDCDGLLYPFDFKMAWFGIF
jgi:hypothetical protein